MALSANAAARKDATTPRGNVDFQHRHFAFIAAELAAIYKSEYLELDFKTWEGVCTHFACKLAGTNPRFDRKRFLNACGLEG